MYSARRLSFQILFILVHSKLYVGNIYFIHLCAWLLKNYEVSNLSNFLTHAFLKAVNFSIISPARYKIVSPFAVISSSIVTANKTKPCVIFTFIGTSIALTLTTTGKVIKALLAFITLPTKYIWIARTISSSRVTYTATINSTDGIAFTGCKQKALVNS